MFLTFMTQHEHQKFHSRRDDFIKNQFTIEDVDPPPPCKTFKFLHKDEEHEAEIPQTETARLIVAGGPMSGKTTFIKNNFSTLPIQILTHYTTEGKIPTYSSTANMARVYQRINSLGELIDFKIIDILNYDELQLVNPSLPLLITRGALFTAVSGLG